ncbi:MAG: AraC family transcriptional regulator [Lachnospiraceae bacterium]|nr:AraC family transcriptional regulator [Lachnospiraceae bacterium]
MEQVKKNTETPGGYRFLLEGTVVTIAMVSYRRFTDVMPEHAHGEDVYELHYVEQGDGVILLNRQSYSASPGVLYITGPGILHEQIPSKENPLVEFGVYLQLQADKKEGELLQGLRAHPLWYGMGRSTLHNLTREIRKEQAGNQPGAGEKLQYLLAEFLIESIRSILAAKEEERILPEPQEKFGTHTIQEENALLVADEIFLYEYRDITLEELAGRLGFSVRQTQRLLNRIYGKSFTQKKLEARMSAAVTLLQNSRYSITEISERLGYASMEHFSYAFSKYYGFAPSTLRKRAET